MNVSKEILHTFLISRRLCAPSLSRCYATSRFPKKVAGVGRSRSTRDSRRPSEQETNASSKLENEHYGSHPLNSSPTPSSVSKPPENVDIGLKKLLLDHDTLVIERQIEMLNIFIGYEQSNKYAISNESGDTVGYIAEDPKGFLGTISRQIFATHRPFNAVIMDQEGRPALWIRRPFAWINSKMTVERSKEHIESHPETFGEVQQIWHPWRRRYDLFLRENFPNEMVSGSTGPDRSDNSTYYQIGKVDSEFLAWKFHVFNQHGEIISTVDRAFRGIGREIFTDTGKYSIHFKPSSLSPDSQVPESMGHALKSGFPVMSQELGIDTRALLLALAVNIDVDYFSRHSHSGLGLFHLTSWE